MALHPIISTQDLLLDPAFIDEKELIKQYLGKAVDTIVMQNQRRRYTYFIVFHEKSDSINSQMKISTTQRLPNFVTNQIVFWVCNVRGICEWLWTVPPKENGKPMRVEFNTEGVAYLQTKGAMPS